MPVIPSCAARVRIFNGSLSGGCDQTDERFKNRAALCTRLQPKESHVDEDELPFFVLTLFFGQTGNRIYCTQRDRSTRSRRAVQILDLEEIVVVVRSVKKRIRN
jgi:hypothetical protein